MRTGGTSTPDVRPNSFYPIYYNPLTEELSLTQTDNSIEIIPIDSQGKRRVWRQTRPSFLELNKKGELKCVYRDGKYSIRIKDRIKDGMKPKTIWNDAKYSATSYGTEVLKRIFDGDKVFSYPKSIHTVKDIIRMVGDTDDIVLDFFAGSGTTGHAVLELNNEDNGTRKFIMCEQMDYAYSVTFERQKRVEKQLGIKSPIVYCELAMLNQKFVEDIKNAALDKDLNDIFQNMISTGYISYRVNPETFDKRAFDCLSIYDKKQFLMEILDKNLLYVNYCDIDDEEFAISKEDKAFTHSFYGMR